ncbi:MAG: hypothetical protein ACUVX1_01925 [Chloroflexota bacterium]
MASYLVLFVQVVLLTAMLWLFVSLRRRYQTQLNGQHVSDVAELCGALNEMIEELQDLIKATSQQLTEKNGEAVELLRAMDERLEALGKTTEEKVETADLLTSWGGVAYQKQAGTWTKSGATFGAATRGPDAACGQARTAFLKVLDGGATSLEIAREFRTGRGEVELMQHLGRWQGQLRA